MEDKETRKKGDPSRLMGVDFTSKELTQRIFLGTTREGDVSQAHLIFEVYIEALNGVQSPIPSGCLNILWGSYGAASLKVAPTVGTWAELTFQGQEGVRSQFPEFTWEGVNKNGESMSSPWPPLGCFSTLCSYFLHFPNELLGPPPGDLPLEEFNHNAKWVTIPLTLILSTMKFQTKT